MGRNDMTAKNLLGLYILLAFAISWVLWAYLVITSKPGSFMEGGPSPSFLVLAVLGGFGPSVAGMICARIINGKGGAGRLLSSLILWRFKAVWYVISLLLVPCLHLLRFVIFAAAGKSLSLDGVSGRLALGLMWPVFASLGEEFGWRQTALPEAQSRFGPVSASLLVGFLWGMWHLPTDYIGAGHYGIIFIPYFILVGPLLLMPYSILMTWVYNRTKGSMPLIFLFHYSITFSAIVLSAQSMSIKESFSDAVLSAGLAWIAAAFVLIGTKGTLGETENGHGSKRY
ncbi:MAG: CPBP family intramembrane metalloprotease [Spirochaetes bacterium]|nr:CPBP family intramembrane metalloprotease [Spirochaetota bacterium]